MMKAAEELAKLFHDLYECNAPDFGYETRKETCVPWDEVPENNKKLMISVVAMILDRHSPTELGYYVTRHMTDK